MAIDDFDVLVRIKKFGSNTISSNPVNVGADGNVNVSDPSSIGAAAGPTTIKIALSKSLYELNPTKLVYHRFELVPICVYLETSTPTSCKAGDALPPGWTIEYPLGWDNLGSAKYRKTFNITTGTINSGETYKYSLFAKKIDQNGTETSITIDPKIGNDTKFIQILGFPTFASMIIFTIFGITLTATIQRIFRGRWFA